jgi:hypothetical protein
MASDRGGLSSCVLRHLSIIALSSPESRIAVTGSWPVGGRPGFLFVVYDIADCVLQLKSLDNKLLGNRPLITVPNSPGPFRWQQRP